MPESFAITENALLNSCVHESRNKAFLDSFIVVKHSWIKTAKPLWDFIQAGGHLRDFTQFGQIKHHAAEILSKVEIEFYQYLIGLYRFDIEGVSDKYSFLGENCESDGKEEI